MLVDDALAVAGDVRRAHVVQALELLAARAQLEHVARPGDVDALGEVERDREVVDGGEVEDLHDLALELLAALGLEPESLAGDVAREELDPLGVDRLGALARAVELLLLDQGDDPGVGVGLEERLGEAAADEPGKAGEEEDPWHGAGVYAAAGAQASAIISVAPPLAKVDTSWAAACPSALSIAACSSPGSSNESSAMK